MGYASTFWEILNYKVIANTDDDQLFYTHVYLDKDFRERHKIQLDGTSKIFHNLHGAIREIEMGFGNGKVSNWEMGTNPQVLHGNGPTKNTLNTYGNYFPKAFDPTVGFKGECQVCEETEDLIDIEDEENLPVILTSMFITGNYKTISKSVLSEYSFMKTRNVSDRTPFIDYFINNTFTQNYPPHKWHVRIYNRVWGQADHLQELVNFHVSNGKRQFASFELYQPKV